MSSYVTVFPAVIWISLADCSQLLLVSCRLPCLPVCARTRSAFWKKRSKKSASRCSTALNSSQQHVGQDLIFSHLLKNLSSNRCDFSIFDFVNSQLRFSFKMPVENKAPGGEDRLKSFKNKGKDTEVSFFLSFHWEIPRFNHFWSIL